jgi:hypothetical protein
LETTRLQCSTFYVVLRIRDFGGRWIASADTSGGPSLGYGDSSFEAVWRALERFDGVINELLDGAPEWIIP